MRLQIRGVCSFVVAGLEWNGQHATFNVYWIWQSKYRKAAPTGLQMRWEMEMEIDGAATASASATASVTAIELAATCCAFVCSAPWLDEWAWRQWNGQ